MTRKMVEADLYAGLLVKCQRCEREGAWVTAGAGSSRAASGTSP